MSDIPIAVAPQFCLSEAAVNARTNKRESRNLSVTHYGFANTSRYTFIRARNSDDDDWLRNWSMEGRRSARHTRSRIVRSTNEFQSRFEDEKVGRGCVTPPHLYVNLSSRIFIFTPNPHLTFLISKTSELGEASRRFCSFSATSVERRATSVEAASSPSSWSTYRGTSSRALGWVTKRIIGTVADRTNSNFLAAWSDLYIISLSPIYHRSRDNYSKVYPSLTVLTGSTCELDTRPSTLRCIPRGRPPSPTAERSNS